MLSAGELFAGYQVDRLLRDDTGAGATYLAHHPDTGAELALRVLPLPISDDEPYSQQFFSAADATRMAAHDALVPLRNRGWEAEQLWLCWDFVPGLTLAELVSRGGPISVAEALALLEPVAGALDAIHAAGLVHRNVRPSAVIVDGAQDTVAHLAEFGLAFHPSLIAPSSGAPSFAPPELLQGGQLDRRSDLYGLAALLLFALSGRSPFPPDRAGMQQLVSGEDPLAAGPSEQFPAPIDSVLRRGLATNPDQRFGSGRELIDAARSVASSVARTPAPPAEESREDADSADAAANAAGIFVVTLHNVSAEGHIADLGPVSTSDIPPERAAELTQLLVDLSLVPAPAQQDDFAPGPRTWLQIEWRRPIGPEDRFGIAQAIGVRRVDMGLLHPQPASRVASIVTEYTSGWSFIGPALWDANWSTISIRRTGGIMGLDETLGPVKRRKVSRTNQKMITDILNYLETKGHQATTATNEIIYDAISESVEVMVGDHRRVIPEEDLHSGAAQELRRLLQ